jgi:hypothetical protein
MSFGKSVFSARFIQEIVKEDLFVKANHIFLRWYRHRKTLEHSKRLSTEDRAKALTCGDGWPHL